MGNRVPLILAGVAAAGVGAWILLAGGDGDAKPAPTAAAPARPMPSLPTANAARALPDGPGSAERPRTNREWTVPGQTAVFVEQLEAKEDPVQEAANRLTYKKNRLRFKLSDAAAECYSGEDSKADLQVGYTLVVESEVLRVENVRMLDSNLPDAAVEKCILEQIRDLQAPADDIPDLREEGTSWISLHDLFVRNRPKD